MNFCFKLFFLFQKKLFAYLFREVNFFLSIFLYYLNQSKVELKNIYIF